MDEALKRHFQEGIIQCGVFQSYRICSRRSLHLEEMKICAKIYYLWNCILHELDLFLWCRAFSHFQNFWAGHGCLKIMHVTEVFISSKCFSAWGLAMRVSGLGSYTSAGVIGRVLLDFLLIFGPKSLFHIPMNVFATKGSSAKSPRRPCRSLREYVRRDWVFNYSNQFAPYIQSWFECFWSKDKSRNVLISEWFLISADLIIRET